ncbi:MAG TPA: DUF6152 family protein [Gammaproteobacteria bacterium]
MRSRLPLVLVALGTSLTLNAHHSVPVNFDQSRQITIEGMLTQIEWRNPHSHFRVDVATEDGSVQKWLVEMGSANAMRRAGYPFERFVVNEEITIVGWPGRRDETIFLLEAILSDGTRLVCGGGNCSPRSTDDRILFEEQGAGN